MWVSKIGHSFSFLEEGKVVFVHCRHGISRSVTIAFFYLMRKNGYDLKTALQLMKKKRAQANPHVLFLVALNLYQEQQQKET